jgi:hypothetical protein
MSRHPDSRWTHPVCDDCWYSDNATEIEPSTNPNYVGTVEIRQPLRFVEAQRQWEQCCRCGSMSFSGIFVRGDPNSDDFKHWCMESEKHREVV